MVFRADIAALCCAALCRGASLTRCVVLYDVVLCCVRIGGLYRVLSGCDALCSVVLWCIVCCCVVCILLWCMVLDCVGRVVMTRRTYVLLREG